jgi:hypothetical protein
VGAWLFAHSIIPPFCLPFDVFSSMLHTRLGFSHLLALKVTHAFMTNLKILQGPTFFIAPMVGNGLHPMDVVIANFTQINLVFHVTSSHKVVAMVVAQAKERLYHD